MWLLILFQKTNECFEKVSVKLVLEYAVSIVAVAVVLAQWVERGFDAPALLSW